MSKNLINSPEKSVDDCLYGFSKLHPNLKIFQAQKIVMDSGSKSDKKVVVISGGGSGHEPFPAGYVGKGMLTASVSGLIFTSPPSNNILHAIRLAVRENKQVLLIIPNYTGDVLNFGLAAEIAITEGIPVECIVVGEDIAQEVYGITNKTGKRGMCGIVLIFKIAGYLSEIGEDLETIKSLLFEAMQSMASMGLCISSCSKPGLGKLFDLKQDEMELGIGVHGEAGVARLKLLTASDAVKILLDFLVKYLKIKENDKVVVLINNLGSLSYHEQWLLTGEIKKQLSTKNINVLRLFTGCFFTSLNMAGLQICILKLDHKTIFLEALDYETNASAWPKSVGPSSNSVSEDKILAKIVSNVQKSFPACCQLSPEKVTFVKQCLVTISNDLIKQESYLNWLDSVCGDGDCGSTFSHLANEILSRVVGDSLDFSKPTSLFFDLSLVIQESVGGTSGVLYGLFFKAISHELEKCESYNEITISKCWRKGIDGIKKYSTARVGDRTMLDSLETACEVFEKGVKEGSKNILEVFRSAVKASEIACQKTKLMKASAGRASYTDQLQQKNIDAGAYAVTVWLSSVLRVMEQFC